MALNFLPQTLTKEQIEEIFTSPETRGFNRIAMQHYTTDGREFGLVAQVMSPSREKIGPAVIYLKPGPGKPVSNSRDFVFGQYEVTKVQLKKLSKDFTVDVIFTPKMSEINPESTDYDANGDPIHPSPPAPPPNP